MTLAPDERLVVDASVAIKWVVTEAGSEQAVTLRGHALIAPDLLFCESANILWRKVRHGLMTEEEADLAARTLQQADLGIVLAREYMARAVAIAVELDHPAYDAICLAVADALGLRLATADYRLLRKVGQGRTAFRGMLLPLYDIVPSGQTGYSA